MEVIFCQALDKEFRFVTPFFPEMDLKTRFERHLIEVSWVFKGEKIIFLSHQTKAYNMRSRLDNLMSSLEHEYLEAFYEERSQGLKQMK